MSVRSVLGICAVAATCALATPAGAAGNDTVFDAVSGFQATASARSDETNYKQRPFVVTGMVRGQAQERTVSFAFGNEAIAERYAASCERFALLAMKSAGHFAFVVVSDPAMPNYVAGCRLEKR